MLTAIQGVVRNNSIIVQDDDISVFNGRTVTNIIIDYWKNPDDWTTKIFKKEDIAICGVVEAELIHGARSDKDIRNIITAISGY